MDYLSKKHPHVRDQYITFDEEPHIYTIKGDSDYTSVTTFVHSHFPHFDADKIITKMMNSHRWTSSKYYGMTPEEIKQQWADSGKEAREAGTEMHLNIEQYYNNIEVNNDSTEYSYFKQFEKDYQDLIPYRTEWMIYDEELKFAGSVDMIYRIKEHKDNTDNPIVLEIYDWKRCKQIKMNNPWQSGITECVSHLPDSNFWHYSLQLNTYKALLEKNYDVKINDMYLVCLHPDNYNDSYLRIQVEDMTDEINELFKLRKEELKKLEEQV